MASPQEAGFSAEDIVREALRLKKAGFNDDEIAVELGGVTPPTPAPPVPPAPPETFIGDEEFQGPTPGDQLPLIDRMFNTNTAARAYNPNVTAMPLPPRQPTPLPQQGPTGAPRGVLPRGGQIGQGAQPPSPEEGMPLSDTLVRAGQNFGPSLVKEAKNMAQPFLHPVETAKALGNLGMGLIELAIPGEQGSEKYAEAVGKHYTDKYGGVEQIKKAIAEDPVSVLADVSVILTGGGTLAARAPGTLGQIGKTVATVGDAANPVNIAAGAAKLTAKPVGKLSRELIGNFGTHTGGESLRQAYRAGKDGGSRQATFKANLAGRVPNTDVVSQTADALARMRKDRSDAYEANMVNVRGSNQTISMDTIDRVVDATEAVGKFKGVTVKKSAAEAFEKIRAQVDEWRALDSSQYHTPAGLDALKQAVYDIGDSYPWGTASKKVVMDVYHKIRSEIAKAAPDYDKAMKGYSEASDMIDDISRTLSIQGPKTNVDTALRKLASVMRNNVNTNYGRRVDLVDALSPYGGADIMPALAGQVLNKYTPRGLGSATTGPAAAYLAYTDPVVGLPALAAQSPRLMGEAANMAGRGARAWDRAGPTVARASLLSNLIGRHSQESR